MKYIKKLTFLALAGMLSLNVVAQQSTSTSIDNMTKSYSAELEKITDPTQKAEYVLKRAAELKTYDEFKVVMAQFSKYLTNKEQRDQKAAILSKLVSLKPGAQGLNFSYPDKDGKLVSMADLKGKVVLVDIWATWCAPCKQEIPYLEKVAEEFKEKGVEVVSISVDFPKDKEKWLNMIKEKNLGGIQLYANGWSEITEYYQIKGIPRFMVFDRQGKIVNVNAPRPSDFALRTILQQALRN